MDEREIGDDYHMNDFPMMIDLGTPASWLTLIQAGDCRSLFILRTLIIRWWIISGGLFTGSFCGLCLVALNKSVCR